MNKDFFADTGSCEVSKLRYRISEPQRTMLFTVTILTVGIFLIIFTVLSGEQNRTFGQNWTLYYQGIELVNQGQYQQALNTFTKLDEEFANSYKVCYYQAFCWASINQHPRAVHYMSLAQKSHPAFLEDAYFLYEYGHSLYETGDYKTSRIYLLQSLKFAGDEDLITKINGLLSEMAVNNGGQSGNG